jgi:hypothetical protein
MVKVRSIPCKLAALESVRRRVEAALCGGVGEGGVRRSSVVPVVGVADLSIGIDRTGVEKIGFSFIIPA